MAVQQISLGVRSNPSRGDTQTTLVNCYAEDVGEDNESKWVIYACDGFSSFSTLTGSGAGVVKGMLNFDDATLYAVAGQRINAIDTSGTATDLGALATSGYAYLARNRKSPNAQVMIVTSDGLVRLIENNVVTTPTYDPDVPTFNSVCALDGYFILTAANGEWFITSIDEGSAIDPIEFAQANSSPDGAVRGIVRGRDVIIAGPRSLEFYQNTGATDFPFERTTSTNIGVAYAPTMVNLAAVIDGVSQDTVIFAGNNADGSFAGVMMLDGYAARKISSPDLDRAIRDEPTKSSIRAFTRIDNGHVMYCITGTSFSKEYNANTGHWHDRTSTGITPWRIVDACHFNGATILADYAAATLYRQSSSITPGNASTVALRHSNDNGRTWKSRDAKAVGGTGTNKIIRWHCLGQSKEDGKVLEFTFSNAVIENGTGTDALVRTPPVHAFPRRMEFNEVYVNVTGATSLTSRSKGFVNLAVDSRVLEP